MPNRAASRKPPSSSVEAKKIIETSMIPTTTMNKIGAANANSTLVTPLVQC